MEAINLQVAEAVEEHRNGEDVHYGVSLVLMPDPQGNPMPVIAIVISVPGADLGSRIAATHMDQNLQTQVVVPGIVRQMIEQLLQARSQHMKAALTGSPQSNGQGPPQHPSGLIDPRQG